MSTEQASPDLGMLIEGIAREIGAVGLVAKRRSDPDADTRQMIMRLDDWYTRLFDVRDALATPAPDVGKVNALRRFTNPNHIGGSGPNRDDITLLLCAG